MTSPIGDWQWNSASERVSFAMSDPKYSQILEGDWALEDLGRVFDGFSQERLERALLASDSNVSVDITLAAGQVLQLIGIQDEDGSARGTILALSSDLDENEPGPELVPVFQPILSLRRNQIIGFEALARWKDRKGQLVSGDLKETALATHMLIASADALAKFQKETADISLFMHINLTGLDLMDDRLVDLVSALITGHNLEPSTLKLELTEQAALRDTRKALSTIKALKSTGASLVLDDFGSGHSSFLWLADLPADSLKIDAALIERIHDKRVQTILEALTLMAKRLGMLTTAEGVEDIAILPVLRSLGFDHAQGYALGRPQPFDSALAYLISK